MPVLDALHEDGARTAFAHDDLRYGNQRDLMKTFLVAVLVLLGGCASRAGAVRCVGDLEPINGPLPQVLRLIEQGDNAESSPGATRE
jgi:hypothetical protein